MRTRLRVGQRVRCHVNITKGTEAEGGLEGTVRYLGPVQFASQWRNDWVGVELDQPFGKNDGSVKGVQYFKVPKFHGIFLRKYNCEPAPAKPARVATSSLSSLPPSTTTHRRIPVKPSAAPMRTITNAPESSLGHLHQQVSSLDSYRQKTSFLNRLSEQKMISMPRSPPASIERSTPALSPQPSRQAPVTGKPKTTTPSPAASPSRVAAAPSRRIRGLRNLGNTCFFNSVMQQFAACVPLRNMLLGDEPVASVATSAGDLTREVTDLLRALCLGPQPPRGYVDPSRAFSEIVRKNPKFGTRKQQDALEIFKYLLDGMHVETQVARRGKGRKAVDTPTIPQYMFGGRFVSVVRCLRCDAQSLTQQDCFEISLPIPASLQTQTTVSTAASLGGATRAGRMSGVSHRTWGGASRRQGTRGIMSSSAAQRAHHARRGVYPCEFCKRKFLELDELEMHLLTQCAQCPYESEALRALKAFRPRQGDSEGPLSSKYGDAGGGGDTEWGIEECLRLFATSERIGEYKCEKCCRGRERVSASKRMLLLRSPRVLVLHLKRYQQNARGFIRKVTSTVSYPTRLDLSPFVYKGDVDDAKKPGLTPKPHNVEARTRNAPSNASSGADEDDDDDAELAAIAAARKAEIAGELSAALERKRGPSVDENMSWQYRLFGVVCHIGSYRGGHYVAYVKRGDQWCYVSDTRTKFAEERDVLKKQAYMLFYERDDSGGGGGNGSGRAASDRDLDRKMRD